MKKRAILGILIAVAFSLLISGTALAAVVNVTYPPGDPKTGIITEWQISSDGRVHCSGESTVPNGYSAGIVQVGKDGQPVLATFSNNADFVAAQEARGLQPRSIAAAKTPEGQMTPLSGGNAYIQIQFSIYNPYSQFINDSYFLSTYSFNATQITSYTKSNYSGSSTNNGWEILSGPNYTAPYPIPTSTSALGTYNTSYTGPYGEYNWLSLRNRAYPNGGLGYGVSGYSVTLQSPSYYFTYVADAGPLW